MLELEKKTNRLEHELQLKTEQRDRALDYLAYLSSIHGMACPPMSIKECMIIKRQDEKCRECRRQYVMGFQQ